MSELPPPEPTFPAPPRRKAWNVWGTMASAMLHVGALVFLIWQPPPTSANAAPPAAIDVVLVPPPEAVSSSEPPADEPEEEPAGEPDEDAPAEEPNEKPEQPEEETSAATSPPAETTPAELSPAEPSAAPVEPAAESSSPETPSETAPRPVSKPSAAEASEPVRGSDTSSAKVAPIPLSRPKVRGLTAPDSVPAEAIAAVTADTGEVAEGTAPPAPAAEPDVATLELGELRSAERFYSRAMLNAPSMARALEMLETLPPEKRLAQTCILEALAQVGNAGQGFAPDVVMAEAYARLETTGTRLTANGAIFRSGESWYGLAFDCTLSDDLTSVTAFSYRLGADVTDAVLARLSKT